jgi:CheY-like chemotaxis protein
MKIDYKILWLDDQIDLFIEDELIDKIEKHLIENGFNPIVSTAKKSDLFFEKLDDSYDLILTDYHMNDIKGDLVVEKIREQSILTEILFYTAKADLKETHKLDRISFLETSKYSGSGSHEAILVREIKKLIDLTIKKFQHIVAIRGMIMHETSFLDERMLQIVNTYLEQNEDDKETREKIFDDIIGFFKEKYSKSQDYQRKDRIDKIVKDPLMFSSAQRANVIKSIIEKTGGDDFVNDYKKEIINLRNQFAHSTLKKNEQGIEYFENRSEQIIFDALLCKKIRTDIIKHKGNIDSLEIILKKG